MRIEQQPIKVNWFKVLLVPGLTAAVMLLLHLIDPYIDISLRQFGIHPRKIDGLPGIAMMPLLHSSWQHLFSNLPGFLLMGGLIYLHYREVANRVFIFSWLITGFWVWIMARTGTNHVGASGMVYSFASFLFFSGLFRRHKQLMAISLVVTFLYGGLWWGAIPTDFWGTALPFLKDFQKMSWEGHLSGGIAGLLLAINYRKIGLQKERYDWEFEDEEEDEPGFDDWKLPPEPLHPGQRQVKVRYIYRSNPPVKKDFPKPSNPDTSGNLGRPSTDAPSE